MSTLDSAQIEARVREALAALSIVDWEWIPIDPQFGDTADFCAEYGFDLPHCAQYHRGGQQTGRCLVRGMPGQGLRPPGCEPNRAPVDGRFQGILRVCRRHQ